MLSPGELIEGTPYRVLRELGAGGMGVVYEVEHARLGKRYVAKVLHPSIQHIPDALARIDREARVMAELNHPSIVQIHDVGTTPGGVRYLVMEKLEGTDLKQHLSSGKRPRAAESIRIVADILEALAYVHQRGIVHRDIKPANIFLADSPTGTVTKVLDFGIAHLVEGQTSQALTKAGDFIGTLEYSAPEQMQGQPAGPPTDVYSAGLMLFELIAGRGAFADAPGVGVVRCFQPAPPLSRFAQVSPALNDLVARMIAIDPASRPSAREVVTTLRALPADAVHEDTTIGASVDELLGNLGRRPSGVAPPVQPKLRETGPQMPAQARRETGPQLPAQPQHAPMPAVAAVPPVVDPRRISVPYAPPQAAAPMYAPPYGNEGSQGMTGAGLTSTVDRPAGGSKAAVVGALVAALALASVFVGVAVYRHMGTTRAAAEGSATTPVVTASGTTAPSTTTPSAATTVATLPAAASAAAPVVSAVTPAASASTAVVVAPAAGRKEPVAKPAAAPPSRPTTPPRPAAKGGYITELPDSP